MTEVENVLIVGGGAAELCAAIALSTRGIRVEVVELNEEMRPLGSGLTMNGASLRALRHIDEATLEQCVCSGVGHPALTFRTADGTLLHRVPMPQAVGPEYPGGFGIMRPVLCHGLRRRRTRTAAGSRCHSAEAACGRAR